MERKLQREGEDEGDDEEAEDRSRYPCKGFRSPASAGFFLGRPNERYKVTTDDVPYIGRSRLPQPTS
jgi:hypothetical protein